MVTSHLLAKRTKRLASEHIFSGVSAHLRNFDRFGLGGSMRGVGRLKTKDGSGVPGGKGTMCWSLPGLCIRTAPSEAEPPALQRVNPVSDLVLVRLFQGGFDISGRRCYGANVCCERPP